MRSLTIRLLLALLLLTTMATTAGAQDEDPRRERKPLREQREKQSPEKSKSEQERRDEPRESDRDRRPIRDDRSDRDEGAPGRGDRTDRDDDTPDSTGPVQTPAWENPRLVPDAPLTDLPGAGYYSDFSFEVAVLDCPDAVVCWLEPLDDYYAWMLVGQTSIPYLNFALLRGDGLPWEEVLIELEIEPWEAYAAVGVEGPPADASRPLSDELLLDLAREHTVGISLPRFDCSFPVEIEGVAPEDRSPDGRFDERYRDFVAEEIAARISEETGWCRSDLMQARRLLGSWSRVAKRLYISPFLFEASFGIELQIDQVGSRRLVRYPSEVVIREVAETGAWPEVTRR